jgi:hypothetical protein
MDPRNGVLENRGRNSRKPERVLLYSVMHEYSACATSSSKSKCGEYRFHYLCGYMQLRVWVSEGWRSSYTL